jgi:hypothetical protein
MPYNLLKSYNHLLELMHLSVNDRIKSLSRIFVRDVESNINFKFRSKQIYPVKRKEGDTDISILFNHLTTQITDKSINKRDFEPRRSERLHWLKYHIEETKTDGILVFSVEDPDGIRTYIFDELENYVIILAPYRDGMSYYLLTAYFLEGRNSEKIKKKYKRRLPNLF